MSQTVKLSRSRTIIASKNKANDVSIEAKEHILASLSSKLFVAYTRTNEIVNNALSTNVSPEKLASKYSSPNMQSGSFRAAEHSSVVSSKASVRKPEIALTTSVFSGIILPSWSVDKKYLSTSQAGDNSNGYSSQGALAKSAFANGLNSQTGQFSSSNSILRLISIDYDASASTNDGSRLFTKGSMSLAKLPRTVFLSSQIIWKTTDLNPRTSQTNILFSDKVGIFRSDAIQKSDTKTSTSITSRSFSSISGMSQVTLEAKMTQDESYVTSATFLTSRTTTANQNGASSRVFSDIQKGNSQAFSVVMASPSLSSKAREVSSRSHGAAMTVSMTLMPRDGVPSRENNKLSSRPENKFRTLTYCDEKENSSQMSSTTMHSSVVSASDAVTRDSASISQDAENALFSSHVSSLTRKTTRLALSSWQTQPLQLKASEVNLETPFTDSAKTFSSTTSLNVSPSLQASLKAEDMTKFLTRSTVQPTDWIPSSASEEFSAFNTDENRKTLISGSSSLHQKRSLAVSDVHSFSPSSSTLIDKSKLQTSSVVSAASLKNEITPGVIVSLREEIVTSYRATSTKSGATLHPTQTMSSLSTLSGNVSTGTPATTASNSNRINLPTVSSSVKQSAIQKETSLVSSVVMASPFVSNKARKRSATVTISTPPMIQPPSVSKANSMLSSRSRSESRSSESSRFAKNSLVLYLTTEHGSRDTATISIDEEATASVPQEMISSAGVSTLVRSSAAVSARAERSSSLAVSSFQTESLQIYFANSTKTFVSRTSVNLRIYGQATKDLSSLSSSTTKAETNTGLLTLSPVKPTNWIPFSSSDTFSDSHHEILSSSSSRSGGHEVRFSSRSDSSAMTSKLTVSSPSYSRTPSQIPYKEVSVYTSFVLTRSSSHSSSRPMPQKRSSAVSEDQNSSTPVSFSASTLLQKSKLQTSSAVPATSLKNVITSVVIVPVPDDSVTTYKASSTQLGVTVYLTQTRSTSATVAGNLSTGPPTTAAAETGHINLLIVVAIIPSIILCAFFAAVLFYRRSRKRRNKAVYSIKLEYADENNGFRKRCVNSRLDLSLKGIHIDLEFPNASSDRDRRGSYSRDSPRYSRGSTLSETQMRELQILSQECRENMEWISEVIAREMEASICGRIQPVNRESVYSVKEKENYEPSEKVIRRDSSKRGRESVKWRVPVVQRRDSDDFDQRDSMCTDDTTLFPEEWKDGHENSERSTRPNGADHETQQKNHKPNSVAEKDGDEAKLDKELRTQLSNKKLDKLQSQDNEKQEKELQENIPITVNLNSKKEDSCHVTQGKRSSSRPRRSESL